MRVFLLICAAVCILSPYATAANSGRDDLHRFLTGLPQAHEQEAYFQYSRRFAPTTGPWIIDAIIPDLRRERDDSKFILYLSLAFYLERAPTEQALQGWLHSKRQTDRIWAREFLTELAAHPETRSTAHPRIP